MQMITNSEVGIIQRKVRSLCTLTTQHISVNNYGNIRIQDIEERDLHRIEQALKCSHEFDGVRAYKKSSPKIDYRTGSLKFMYEISCTYVK